MVDGLTCHICGNVEFDDGTDGFYYCLKCGSQAEDIMDTGVADEDFVEGDTRGAIYLASHRRQRSQRSSAIIKAEPISQYTPAPTIFNYYDDPNENRVKKKGGEEGFMDSVGPTGPSDFGSSSGEPAFEDYYNEVRMRYIMGLQLMIEWQCEALVEKFGASALICGMAGSIWLRYVAVSRVFDDGWADVAIQESELKKSELPDNVKVRAKYSAEPHNLFGERAVTIWYRSLRKMIPLSTSLAVSFLACHAAREAILPTDILKWSLEGKLPYFSAFVEIKKYLGRPSSACPLSLSFMFRPLEAVPLQKLESMAASVAQTIGLNLPPVNFYAIASRYLKQLSLPLDRILDHACHICEWSMPSELWLSANELRLPSRVCVMSTLIIAIRILYNLHGFGIWEKSLLQPRESSSSCKEAGVNSPYSSKVGITDEHGSGSPSCDLGHSVGEPPKDSSDVKNSELGAAEILHNLEANNNKIAETYEYSKDLPTYLQYCKDVVFAGLELSFEHYEEEKIIEQLWDFYNEEQEPSEENRMGGVDVLNQKRSRDPRECVNCGSKQETKKSRDEECSDSQSTGNGIYHSVNCQEQSLDRDFSSPSSCEVTDSENPSRQASMETHKDEAIRRLKSDMEENRFCYIPPRVNLKRFDYLHYVRKRDEGSFTYVAHADYYILLRACAKVAQVDIRIMHIGVLSLERRLAWIEKRIDHCLQLTPLNISCQFCRDQEPQHAKDD